MKITAEQIKEIHRLLDFGIAKGGGERIPGKMCIEQVVACALGKEHTDTLPDCVLPEINRVEIALNDYTGWKSSHSRAKGMAKIAIAQLGSTEIDPLAFNAKLKQNLNKIVLPFLIKKHAENVPDEEAVFLESCSKQEPNEELRRKLFKHYKHYYYYYYNNYDYDYSNYDYYNSLGEEFILRICDALLQTLIELKSPGCQWLGFLPRQA